jgi:DNA-binding IclR family transcriptional regulator
MPVRASRARKAQSGGRAPPKGERGATEAIDRAARILFVVARHNRPSSLVEIARGTDLSKPTAFRILATLAAEGLVVQDERTASYRLGMLPLQLGAAVLQTIPIRGLAYPVMQAIRDQVGESVILSVREGDARYNIDSVEAANMIGQTHRIGVAIPLHAGAASRVLLAGMADEDLRAYVGRTRFVPYSETTIVDPEEILAEVARIRKQGHAISRAEFTPGGVAVAMAVSDENGRTVAALHVSIPRSRTSPAVEEHCLSALREGTDRLARSLRPDPARQARQET